MTEFGSVGAPGQSLPHLPGAIRAGWRRLRAPLVAAAGTIGATIVVALHDPNAHGSYPTCPFLALTGLPCPLCGGLRAAHALAHGDLLAALGHNALAVALMAAATVAWIGWITRRWRGRPPRINPSTTAVRTATLALIGVSAVFMAVRWIPVFGFLGPS